MFYFVSYYIKILLLLDPEWLPNLQGSLQRMSPQSGDKRRRDSSESDDSFQPKRSYNCRTCKNPKKGGCKCPKKIRTE